MFIQMVFSKVHPEFHNIVNGIKPGRNTKRLLSMLHLLKSCTLERKVLYVRCINCSYNHVARVIGLLDKKRNFCFYRKNFMQVRAFVRYIPLMNDSN